jgi:hypothetical protein
MSSESSDKGMIVQVGLREFAPRNIYPFNLGGILLCGLLLVPAVALHFSHEIPFRDAIIGGLISALAFIVSFDMRGNFRWYTAVPAVMLLTVGVQYINRISGHQLPVLGGAIGFIVFYMFSYLGISVGMILLSILSDINSEGVVNPMVTHKPGYPLLLAGSSFIVLLLLASSVIYANYSKYLPDREEYFFLGIKMHYVFIILSITMVSLTGLRYYIIDRYVKSFESEMTIAVAVDRSIPFGIYPLFIFIVVYLFGGLGEGKRSQGRYFQKISDLWLTSC